jgi:hypothetical protein
MEARVNRRAAAWWLPALLTILFVSLPLATGARSFFLRDVFNTHLGLRAFLGDAMREGRLPIVDPLRAGGQGLVGNPNAVPLYPDNLLLLAGSTLWQLNAHFWLHWLLALPAAYWLGRAWGLGREGAGAAALCYALSGYFLSQLNLYNAVAPVALAPALAAAVLWSGRAARRGRAAAAVGVAWGLTLLGGDPLLAVISLGVTLWLALAARDQVAWRAVALGLALGTVVAVPQIVEFVRLLPASFRGYWGQDAASQVKAAPEPAALLEMLSPLFFGRPDMRGMWGTKYYGGTPPLYFSLAPGLLALAWLRLGAGRAGSRERWALALTGLTLALAYSGAPGAILMAKLPGGNLFRFPIKFVLGAAVAGSLLAGRGVERMLGEPSGPALFRRTLLVLGAAQLALFLLFLLPGNLLEAPFEAIFARKFTAGAFAENRLRFAFVAALQLALVGAAALGSATLRRRPAALAATLALLHASTQLYLLRPLVVTEPAAGYRATPERLARLPADGVLTHGEYMDIFGGLPLREIGAPDMRGYWLHRRAQRELFSYPALLAGRRTEFNFSPEGLDSFLVQSIAIALRTFDDAGRLGVLRATGVDFVLLPRPLDAAAAPLAELAETFDGEPPQRVYRVREAIGDAQLLGAALFAPHVQAAINLVLAPGFDPREVAVLAGQGPPRAGPPGTARALRFDADEIELEVDSPAGGFVVVRRAWLPIWRAEVDGVAAKPIVAQLTRLGVEVPPGPHRVRFHVSRRPFRIACGAALAALVAIVALAWKRPGAPRAEC